MTKPRLRTYKHPWAITKGQHHVAIYTTVYPGPRGAVAYLKGERIYTRDACFHRDTGELIYGLCRVPVLGTAEHVLTPENITGLALWGPLGWEWIKAPEGVDAAEPIRAPLPGKLTSLDD